MLNVDGLAGRYGSCPYTGTGCLGARPRVNNSRLPSSPAANIKDPKMN
jgi:hypothetical protein